MAGGNPKIVYTTVYVCIKEQKQDHTKTQITQKKIVIKLSLKYYLLKR